MKREEMLLDLRERLQKRRRGVLESSMGHSRELEALKGQERDPELEENAQTELADFTLSSLLESQRRELMMIDAALRRMDSNVYGICVDCGDEIRNERLRALPFAVRCEEDARERELELRNPTLQTAALTI